jgi:hypothetical protein
LGGIVRTDDCFEVRTVGRVERAVDAGESQAAFGVIDERADRPGIGDRLGERAPGVAAVFHRRDVLGPRLDARLGDAFEVCGLGRNCDPNVRLGGNVARCGRDPDRIGRVRLQVDEDEHTEWGCAPLK